MKNSLKHVIMEDFRGIHTDEIEQDGTTEVEDDSHNCRGCVHIDPLIVIQVAIIRACI